MTSIVALTIWWCEDFLASVLVMVVVVQIITKLIANNRNNNNMMIVVVVAVVDGVSVCLCSMISSWWKMVDTHTNIKGKSSEVRPWTLRRHSN